VAWREDANVAAVERSSLAAGTADGVEDGVADGAADGVAVGDLVAGVLEFEDR
jgi:hypothetical protein